MSRERELLRRALEDMECGEAHNPDYQKTMDDIRAELEKPEPVECGVFEITRGSYGPLKLPNGKYRLLAVRIDDVRD